VSEHEVVVRFGRPFDIRARDCTLDTGGDTFRTVREITVPFADRESAEAAQREITVSVRPVHDAGGEDYRPVVPGEVIREPAEIEGGAHGLTGEDLRDLERRANRPCPGCGHLPGAHEGGRPSTTLYCRDCPDGICYTWTPGTGEVGPGALPHTREAAS